MFLYYEGIVPSDKSSMNSDSVHEVGLATYEKSQSYSDFTEILTSVW